MLALMTSVVLSETLPIRLTSLADDQQIRVLFRSQGCFHSISNRFVFTKSSDGLIVAFHGVDKMPIISKSTNAVVATSLLPSNEAGMIDAYLARVVSTPTGVIHNADGSSSRICSTTKVDLSIELMKGSEVIKKVEHLQVPSTRSTTNELSLMSLSLRIKADERKSAANKRMQAISAGAEKPDS